MHPSVCVCVRVCVCTSHPPPHFLLLSPFRARYCCCRSLKRSCVSLSWRRRKRARRKKRRRRPRLPRRSNRREFQQLIGHVRLHSLSLLVARALPLLPTHCFPLCSSFHANHRLLRGFGCSTRVSWVFSFCPHKHISGSFFEGGCCASITHTHIHTHRRVLLHKQTCSLGSCHFFLFLSFACFHTRFCGPSPSFPSSFLLVFLVATCISSFVCSLLIAVDPVC